MIDAAAAALKTLLAPGSVWLFLVALTAGEVIGLAFPRRQRAALLWLGAVLAAYWLASLPAVANGLSTGFGFLPHRPVLEQELHGVQAVVILGGGAASIESAGQIVTLPSRPTALNTFEGVRVFRLLKGDVDVIPSGGIVDRRFVRESESSVMRRMLIEAGVPAHRIIPEAESRTTHEQAQRVGALLKARGWQRVALVAAPVHLLRGLGSFAAEGVDAVPAPAAFVSERPGGPPPWWKPSVEALERSTAALYDYSAVAYYWMRGWTKRR
jgi:uncharacterized SAM-binding protein YcdF (DUF218 family)